MVGEFDNPDGILVNRSSWFTIEVDRGNSMRTHITRLAAIRSFFHYAGLNHPEHTASVQRVLAIPPKRFERNLVTFSTNPKSTHS